MKVTFNEVSKEWEIDRGGTIYCFDSKEEANEQFEVLACPHEDNITYYDVRANWEYNGEHFRAIDVKCDTCNQTGVQIEVLDNADDEYRFVTEYWDNKELIK